MLVETKAKVGVFSIALGAYLPQFPSLVPEFEAQYDAFKKTLPDTVEIIDGGMVTTKEQSQAAGDLFRAAGFVSARCAQRRAGRMASRARNARPLGGGVCL